MTFALIVAAGQSSRMNGKNKLLAQINCRPLLAYTISVFEKAKDIDAIHLVTSKQNKKNITNFVHQEKFQKVKQIINGGKERQDSVLKGLKAIKQARATDVVLVHNGANPMLTEKEIQDVVKTQKIYTNVVVGHPVKDTLKEVDGRTVITKGLKRDRIWGMQTPQASTLGNLVKAYKYAGKNKISVTDEAAALELIHEPVKVIQASENNYKITTERDLKFFETHLLHQPLPTLFGIGQDSHRFLSKYNSKKPLILGGVVFPENLSMDANSDGDVVLHALFNALSSALGDRSIGCYADEMCLEKGITDSKKYLKVVLKKLKKLKVNNVSISIECKKPKIEPQVMKMKKSLSRLLNVNEEQIGITATSGEGLSDAGKGKGVNVIVVCSTGGAKTWNLECGSW